MLCSEGLDQVAGGIPAAPFAEIDEKRKKIYCEIRLEIRRDLCDPSI